MDEPISRRLMQLAKIYLGAFSKQVEYMDITRYHYILLLIAEYEGQPTQKKLAQITGKDKSAMVSIVDLLSTKGYVYREINPYDRREQLIKLTDKARQDIPAIKQSFALLNNKATEGISPQKLDIFNDVLNQMAVNLKPLDSYLVSFRKKIKKTNTKQ
ncbi:DNA-binding MarR family transcriptional regulator [Mucilaginibacter gracilis]|uniref:DNA-binding MarR family transcriptional regulator n=1 Tax=Mucilaginibacter gracilis TaxID=423350 RepID=A0A495IYP2_9SPHI|nr:MarR family winged helix-turn-helix transcriptional regulator [Mucilaginibacter gracilis]RKR81807.1 DNA-binding MarR family transcriptional regulator [Mucilaginibacter gracilis]